MAIRFQLFYGRCHFLPYQHANTGFHFSYLPCQHANPCFHFLFLPCQHANPGFHFLFLPCLHENPGFHFSALGFPFPGEWEFFIFRSIHFQRIPVRKQSREQQSHKTQRSQTLYNLPCSKKGHIDKRSPIAHSVKKNSTIRPLHHLTSNLYGKIIFKILIEASVLTITLCLNCLPCEENKEKKKK